MKAVRFSVADGQTSFKELTGLNRFAASDKDPREKRNEFEAIDTDADGLECKFFIT